MTMLSMISILIDKMRKFYNNIKYFTFIILLCFAEIAFITVPVYADPLSGLDTRPSNSTCLAGSPPPTTAVFQDVFTQIWTYKPFDLRQSPVDQNRWYFITRAGQLYTFVAPNGTPKLLLDISDKIGVLSGSNAYATGGSEQWGLVGFAFDPDFASNGYVFLLYNGRQANEAAATSYVARYTSSGDGTTFDRQSEKLIISQLQNISVNHHFGQVEFAPDGFLYIGSGDGSSGPTTSPAQNCADLHGKILRLNVNTTAAYTIPGGNPFVGNATCRGEIYALGLRNPWRFSFDTPTKTLWVGDVGGAISEEVDIIVKGGNYGWPAVEGFNCRVTGQCNTASYNAPVYEVLHQSQPAAVIGGYVYRGTAIPTLTGNYLFSVFQRQIIINLKKNAQTQTWDGNNLISGAPTFTSHFVDRDGEFYGIVGHLVVPKILKLVPDSGNVASVAAPALLSATGCVDPANPRQVIAAAIPYTVATPLWSDGAAKQRWVALPDNGKITIGADGDFQFPVDSVLIKEFSFNGKPHETRLLKHHTDGSWAGYSYAWRADLSDADLVPTEGKTASVKTDSGSYIDWGFPSQAQCLVCHTEAANFALGPEILQLNHISPTAYTQTGRFGNELSSWAAIGMFDAPLPAAVADLPTLADLSNSSVSNTLRARSYLHANCSGCHRPNGPTRASLDFRYTTTTSGMNACNVAPSAGDLGVTGAMPLTVKKPQKSLVYLRMNRRDTNQMPPLGTKLIDPSGTKLIYGWINRDDVCTDFADSDADGVPDNVDNCSTFANADQQDSDGNKIGNRCDGDFSGDGVVNDVDRGKLVLQHMGTKFGDPRNGPAPTWGPRFDLNGDGFINAADLAIFDQDLNNRPLGASALR
ncbi:PQQ-dependent sugar dehydrogenase [Defluviicoccus vanus]|uniref:PQQ-dependent sugar dehydrogenase n=1 Tax=Defluviicoccus vanus TaxID=111831 RepID=A0A7H1N0U1_9PROT|nr:PQQ-dependent sugar dehydrogenase [Defluviicoccus vanus]QNT69327.1 PQQ-dependent sugar dehydrogenase [Defluviicoccus vanus]